MTNDAETLLLGLDFGGTKLAAGLVDSAGKLVAAERQATDAGAGAEASLARMLGLARGLMADASAPVRGVGINFGGPVDAKAGIVRTSHHVPGWEDIPLAARVGGALNLPAVLENDANGQALAEWRFGARQGCARLAYLNLGTGIGGGFVLDGRLYRGAHGLAAEFGHMIVRPNGPACTCGRNGCLEALCAGPAMARRTRTALAALLPAERRKAALIQRAGSLDAVTGRDLTALAAEGDALSLQVLDAVFRDLAIGIANLASALDPDLVVLGGGAAEFASRLFDRLRVAVKAACLPALAQFVEIVPAALGADAGIFGGAAAFLAR